MAVTELKYSSSRRVVLVRPEVAEFFSQHRLAQATLRGEIGILSDQKMVSSRADVRPLSPDTVARHDPELCREVGITRKIGFHAIRSESATAMLDVGLNPKILAEWLGHSSTRTTLDIYV